MCWSGLAGPSSSMERVASLQCKDVSILEHIVQLYPRAWQSITLSMHVYPVNVASAILALSASSVTSSVRCNF